MAPSYSTADLAYRNAANALSATCTGLEYYLPDDPTQMRPTVRLPTSRPRQISISACVPCAEELEAMDPGSREGHRCTHQLTEGTDQDSEQIREKSTADGSRKRQPNAGVIRQYLGEVKEKFDAFTKALSTLVSVCDDESEGYAFEQHLLTWAEYVADLRARAADVLQLLEAPVAIVHDEPIIQATLPSTTVPVSAVTTSTYTQSGMRSLIDALVRDQPSQTGQSSETGMQYGNSNSNASVSGTGQRQARDGVSTVSDRRLESREHPMSAELEFAVKSFDHVITTIDNDLKTMEGEVSLPLENQSETSLNEIRDFCIGIDTMIKKDLKDAAEKVSRLDVLKVTGAPQTMAERLTEFTSRLRTVQGTLRRTRTTVVLGSSIGSNASLTTGSRETTPTADSHRGYKPYI